MTRHKGLKNNGIMNAPMINLRLFFVPGLYLLILLAPFWRGLYFQTELLPALICTSIIFLACLGEQLWSGAEDFFQDPLDLAILAMLLAYILSLFSAVDIHAAVIELLKFSAFGMVYWMAGRAIRDEKDFDILLRFAYLAAIGMAVIGLGAALGWIHMAGAWEDGHIRSTLQYHNALAIYLAALNVVGLALSLKTERQVARIAYAGGNYLLLVVILGSLSRGTWLLYPLAMAGFIMLIPVEYRRRAGYQLLVTLLGGLLAGRFGFNYLKNSQELAAAIFLLLGLLLVIGASVVTIPSLKIKSKDSGEGGLPVPSSGSKSPLAWLAEPGSKRKPWLAVGMVGLVLGFILYMGWHFANTSVMHYIFPDTAIARADKLSLQDNSVQERLDTYRDACKIIKDYPLTGAGGGAWQALYHSYATRLYWSNEVHNYYLKNWVETGIIGILALLALGILFLRRLIKMYPLTRSGAAGVSFWAASVAVLVIAVHSLIDFELSMAAVGFLFFALLGALRGLTANLETTRVIAATVSNKPRDNSLQHNKKMKLVLTVVLAAALALATGITSTRFYVASQAAKQGGSALASQKMAEAHSLYQRASQLDSCQAAYQANLAQLAAMEASQEKSAASYNEALYHARTAAGLEPHNPDLHGDLLKIYGLLGRNDLQLQEAQAMRRANPFLAEPYEIIAIIAMQAAWPQLDKGMKNEANEYFSLVVETRQNMPADLVKSSPALNLAAGQSALLLGEMKLAGEYLDQAIQDGGQYAKTARLWRAAVDYIAGRQKNGAAGSGQQDLIIEDLRSFFSGQA